MDTYIAYFDETGDDGITTKSSSEFVLSSIYMPSEKWQENYDKFKTFRKELRKWTGLNVLEEIHTMHFLRDRGPYKNFGWSREQKQEILLDYAQAISSLNIKAVNVIIDKTRIANQNYPILERDVTLRIFDWNRVDAQGNSRELHVDEAFEAIRFEDDPAQEEKDSTDKEKEHDASSNVPDNSDKPEMPAGKICYEEKFNATTKILRSSFFNLNEIYFEKPLKKTYSEIDSFIIYMCIEGHVYAFTDDEQYELRTGEVMLVPACIPELNLIPEGKSRLLEVYL